MAGWIGALSHVNSAKNAKTPQLVTSPAENLKPKTKQFFTNMNYKNCRICKGFEHLSSSIGWQLMELQIWSRICQHGT